MFRVTAFEEGRILFPILKAALEGGSRAGSSRQRMELAGEPGAMAAETPWRQAMPEAARV